jgi:deazaflavin-dependent oxidoreductase (nitroreductase family)
METTPSLTQYNALTAEQRRRLTQEFNAAVIAEFRANGGVVGGSYPFSGRPMLLLHHRGARTGVVRVAPLGCEPEEDGSRLVFGTAGGAPADPHWCRNLRAHPDVEIEVGGAVWLVHARELHGAERAEAWSRIRSNRPSVRAYEKLTTRAIPVFRLTRTR